MENTKVVTENSKNRWGYIAVIVLLLISNGVFVYLYVNKEKEKEQVVSDLVSTESARKELDAMLKETQDQVMQYKGKNAQMDSVINIKNAEIEAQAGKIKALIKNNQVSKAELDAATDELNTLRYYLAKYAGQIDSLASANKVLTEDLKSTKSTLNKANEKIENLTLDNIKKSNKLTVAAKLRAENMIVTGLQNRSSGKERETSRASRVDQIMVQFKIGDNPAAENGDKEVYLKIISPEGSTISTASSGGGSFEYMGEQALYTQRQHFDFKNNQPTVTFKYAKEGPWQKGKYKVELYCEGFQIGTKVLELD